MEWVSLRDTHLSCNVKLTQLKMKKKSLQMKNLPLKKSDYSKLSRKKLIQLIETLIHYQHQLEPRNEQLRQAQQQCQITSQKYFELYEFAPVGYLIISQSNEILKVNLIGAALLGVTKELLIGQLLTDFVAEEELIAYQLFQQGVLHSECEQYCQLRMTKSDGKVFEAQLIAMRRPQPHQKYIYQLIIHPITHEKLLSKFKQLKKRETLRTLLTLLNATTEPIIILERDGTCVMINQAGAARFGKSVAELVAQNIYSISHSRVVKKNLIEQVIEKKQVICVNEKEREQWFESQYMPVIEPDKEVSRVVICSKNTTAYQKTLLALQEQFQLMETLLQTIPNPIFYKDREGKYLGCNRAFEDFTGYSKTEILNKTVFETWNFAKAEIYHEQDMKLMTKGGVQCYENSVFHRLGYERYVIFNKAVYYDAQGNISGIIGIITDITERKRMEKALQESEARFKAIFNNAAVGIAILDHTGNYLQVNHKLADMFGYSSEDFLRFNYRDLTYHEDIPIYEQQFHQLITNELANYCTDKRFMKKNGEVFWTRMWTSKLQLKPNTLQKQVTDKLIEKQVIINIIIDITECKQAESLISYQLAVIKRTRFYGSDS
jgi:PAS domain S-box-containing protein